MSTSYFFIYLSILLAPTLISYSMEMSLHSNPLQDYQIRPLLVTYDLLNNQTDIEASALSLSNQRDIVYYLNFCKNTAQDEQEQQQYCTLMCGMLRSIKNNNPVPTFKNLESPKKLDNTSRHLPIQYNKRAKTKKPINHTSNVHHKTKSRTGYQCAPSQSSSNNQAIAILTPANDLESIMTAIKITEWLKSDQPNNI